MNKISPKQQVVVKVQPDNKIQLTTIDKRRNRKVNYLYDPINDTFTKSNPEPVRKIVPDALSLKNPQNAKRVLSVASVLSALGIVIGVGANSAKINRCVNTKFEQNAIEDTFIPPVQSPIAGATTYMYPNIDFLNSFGPRAGAIIAGYDAFLKDYSNIDEDDKQVKTKKEDNAVDPLEKTAKKNLQRLEKAGGDVLVLYEDLCKELNMSELETMKFITNLSISPTWGNNSFDTIVFLADIAQESSNDSSKIGDGGAAIGFGQFHKIAVDQVNLVYDTNYTYEDRKDPRKSLEMMALFMRYCAENTDSTEAMLAMYNQGFPNGIKTQAGKEYVDAVYGRIENTNF